MKIKGGIFMIWSLIDDSNVRFNLWRNTIAGYNETFRKGVDPNVCRKKHYSN